MRVTAAVLIATAAAIGGVLMARGTPTAVAAVAPAPVAPAVRQANQQPPERSVVGTLERIDVPAMQFVVTTASEGKLTFRLQNGATIRQGSRTLKPAELTAHAGEKVKVRYREVGKERQASWLVLAARPSGKKGNAALH